MRKILVLSIFALFALFGMFPIAEVDGLIQLVLAVYLGFVFLRALAMFYYAYRERMHRFQENLFGRKLSFSPMVTVIVPAYNEAEVIERTIRNLTSLDYPNFEVLVIDDGSTDNTAAIAHYVAELSPTVPVQVLTQSNAGKAAALNHGLRTAIGDLILCVDADSNLRPHSLVEAVKHFQDPAVGAVAGFVEVGNQKDYLTRLQELEYLVGLNFTRRAMSYLGVVPIIPGPSGLFRREALMGVGGFVEDKKLFAEDAELTLRIIAQGWRVTSEERLAAVTEAPEDVKTLLRQRYRWNRGIYQALMRNQFPLLYLGGFREAALWIYLWADCVINPLLNFSLFVYFLSRLVFAGDLQIFSLWYAFLILLDIVTTVVVTLRHGNLAHWLWLTLVNKFSYYYLLLTWRVLSLMEEWDDTAMTWDKLDRTGHMGEETA